MYIYIYIYTHIYIRTYIHFSGVSGELSAARPVLAANVSYSPSPVSS